MTSEPRGAQPTGLIGRIRASYWDFAGSTRRLLAEQPGDPVLLSFLMIAMMMLAFGGVVELVSAHQPDPALSPQEENAKLQTELMEVLISRFLFGALFIYFVATAITPIIRALGGAGGYYETRVAVIWGVLVSAPPVLLYSVIGGLRLLAVRELDETAAIAFSWAGWIVQTVLLALAFVIWASSIAGAHGFRSKAKVLGVMLAFACAFGALLWGLTRVL